MISLIPTGIFLELTSFLPASPAVPLPPLAADMHTIAKERRLHGLI